MNDLELMLQEADKQVKAAEAVVEKLQTDLGDAKEVLESHKAYQKKLRYANDLRADGTPKTVRQPKVKLEASAFEAALTEAEGTDDDNADE